MWKIFRCPTYYHISEPNLEPKAKKGAFMGYGDRVKRFRIESPSKRKVILSRDAIFYELSMLHSQSEENLCKDKDVIKQVEFESPTIRNFSD